MADIRTHVPDFAGYGDEATRRLADEQIRAIVGEGLALLHFNHPDYFEGGELAVVYDRLILRCEFTNQVVFKEFEYQTLDDDRKVVIGRVDEALIQTALRTDSVGAEQLADYLKDLEAAFDARDKALTNT